MNREHLLAVVWLRWRMRRHQFRRAGAANAVIFVLFAGLVSMAAIGLSVAAFFLARFGTSSPAIVMLFWDGLAAIFLFIWLIGLIWDIQRAEALAIDKFLHLPISPAGIFLINYLSSLFSVTLLIFVPASVSFTAGLTLAHGPVMLLVLPLVTAFFFMVTAVTFQFQGWLAALMANKRRRQTIIALVTMFGILLGQAPNLITQFARKHMSESRPQASGRHDDKNREESEDRLEATAKVVNVVLPPGWLPLGAGSAAAGNVFVPLLGTLGMGLIGAASLWRAYRTTIRIYTGGFTSGTRATKKGKGLERPVETPKAAGNWVEKDLPWLPRRASAVALAAFRSLLRAPEAKMMLLTPFILVIVSGSLMFSRQQGVSGSARPFVALGAMGMVFFSLVQLAGNQFGLDRSGFRALVLCGAPRREILLGKNLALAPFALGLGLVFSVLVQVFAPMPLARFLALAPQFIMMFLFFCLWANLLSILAPVQVAASAFRRSYPKGLAQLMHLLATLLLPLVLLPAALPVGVDLIAEYWGWAAHAVIALLFSVAECGAVMVVYWLILDAEGDLLQARERKVLEVVASKAE